ncbi:MAG: PEP/pyruvate-binding domain-containing protein [Desulfobulbales bacterium]
MTGSSGFQQTDLNKNIRQFASVFKRFRRILFLNNKVLEKIGEMERALGGEYIFDHAFLNQTVASLVERVREVIYTLNALAENRYADLYDRFTIISDHLTDLLMGGPGPLGHLMVLEWRQIHRDLDHLVGAKNANLGEIRAHSGLEVPEGFALTTTAYNFFMEENDLFKKINLITAEDISVEEQAAKISTLFKDTKLPKDIKSAVQENVARIERKSGGRIRFAVRSSAVGEDGTRSFAGQFLSLLDIPPTRVTEACIQVMASRFSAHLLRYLGPTADSHEVPVAVGIQVMVAAKTAGVTYTSDPTMTEGDILSISAVSGPGRTLVGGREDADQYYLGRQYPFPLLMSRITPKDTTIGGFNFGGENEQPPHDLEKGSSILNTRQLHKLAEAAILLEKSFEGPQDIEWAITTEGLLVILQCRPLKMALKPPPPPEDLADELLKAPVIMSNIGQVAQLGVAAGRVSIVTPDTSPENFHVNSIAVCQYASPQISEIVRRAAAIITDIGSPTGHLATIAREFRTPALFGTGIATSVLTEGMEVTVDVEEKKVYGAIIPGLLSLKQAQDEPLADFPEMRILRRLLRLVAPLTLQDPADPDFQAKNCRTFHDILRFCHEKAVETLIALHSSAEMTGRKGSGRLLDISIPIKIRVIDLGGGVAENNKEQLTPADIISQPFNAILHGMLNQEAWSREPVPFGFKDLMTSMTSPMKFFSQGHYTGDNLAIIAENYCNLSLRLGYHFNVIDTYLDNDPDDNYIYFRFVGGMAETQKRNRRIELIARILSSLHFKTERQGDLLVGKAKMLSAEHMTTILTSLGELIAFTRQLDVRMVDDATVENLFSQFLTYTLNGWAGQGGQ